MYISTETSENIVYRVYIIFSYGAHALVYAIIPLCCRPDARSSLTTRTKAQTDFYGIYSKIPLIELK